MTETATQPITNTEADGEALTSTTVVKEAENLFPSPERIDLPSGKYIKAVGRRKTSNAQVRLSLGSENNTDITVNGKKLEEYFPTIALQRVVKQPLAKLKYPENFVMTVIVKGGGSSGQAQAVRHGIARVLTQYDLGTRTMLKKFGYLKRDPRAKERKKPGLKKARKAAQWSKR